MPRILILSAATLLAVAPAIADDTHRELGAHVHGHGTLNIALEDTRLSMELDVPGMDIVGFEHAAESETQKAAVQSATALLSEPLKLFKLPADAKCTVASAKVEIEGAADDDGDDHHGHDHDAGHDDHDHDGAKDAHAGHTGFHATYALACAEPAKLGAIAFDYFSSFAGAQGLTVNVVGTNGQSTFEVAREKPVLDLGGMM